MGFRYAMLLGLASCGLARGLEILPGLDLDAGDRHSPPSRPAAVPDEEQQAAAREAMQEAFGEELKCSEAPKRSALAGKLMRVALETAEPAGRYVLMKEAAEAGAQGGNLALAWSATCELTARFAVPERAVKLQTLELLAAHLSGAEDRLGIAHLAETESRFAAKARDYAGALRLISLAAAESAKGGEARQAECLRRREKNLEEEKREYEKARQARQWLAWEPDAPQPNLTAGKFHCFIEGDWATGLPFLRKAQDPMLTTLAIRECEGRQDGLLLGDGWWRVGKQLNGLSQANALARATYWYKQVLPELKGLDLARITARLKEMMEADGRTAP